MAGNDHAKAQRIIDLLGQLEGEPVTMVSLVGSVFRFASMGVLTKIERVTLEPQLRIRACGWTVGSIELKHFFVHPSSFAIAVERNSPNGELVQDFFIFESSTNPKAWHLLGEVEKVLQGRA